MITTTENKLFLVSLSDPAERLQIQFVPLEFQMGRNSDIEDIKIIGRNQPLTHWSGGSSELRLALDFYTENSTEKITEKINWLEKFTFSDGYKSPPSYLKLVWGGMFDNDIFIVKSVNATPNIS